MGLNGQITYGNQGDVLGAKQRAVLDKLATTELAQNLIFDKYATITKGIPQNSGKQITFRKMLSMKDLIIANNIYKDYIFFSVIFRNAPSFMA